MILHKKIRKEYTTKDDEGKRGPYLWKKKKKKKKKKKRKKFFFFFFKVLSSLKKINGYKKKLKILYQK